jgi:hypothetical protein
VETLRQDVEPPPGSAGFHRISSCRIADFHSADLTAADDLSWFAEHGAG